LLPRNLGELLGRFKKVVLPEMNKGQLCMMLRSRYLVDVQSYSKVDGQPFKSQEVLDHLQGVLAAMESNNEGGAR
jgi:2-oxoglutarate ferredoxin oxidoreductase subunit alpha